MQVLHAAGRLVLGLGVVLALASGTGCPSAPQGPQARIGASVRTGEAPLTVHFADLSLTRGVNIATWEWSFGDGATSTQQNPDHTYAAPGYYDVRLVVSNINGTSTVVEEDYIHVVAATLADGDRIGMIVGSTATFAGESVFGSTAYFVPAEQEQLTSLGYFGGSVAETGYANMNLVESLEPDVARVLTVDEFNEYLVPGYTGSGSVYAAVPWTIFGLDAGDAGTVTIGSETSAMLGWEEFPSYLQFHEDGPAITPGVYAQEEPLTPPVAPASAGFAWPGGVDLGPVAVEMEVPEPLSVLSPFVFDGTETFVAPATIDPIDTTQAFTLTWEPSANSAAYVQVVLIVDPNSGGSAPHGEKFLLCKAIDDGSLTIPADVMAQLPAATSPETYRQSIYLSRLVSQDVSVPLPGGGDGTLRVSANGILLFGSTSPDAKTNVRRPFLKYLQVVPR